MAIRVTRISKAGEFTEDPHEAISAFAWTDEQRGKSEVSSCEDLWKWVNEGGEAYVKDEEGNVVRVRAKTNSRGTNYLQTETDGKPSDNLLKLPEYRE